MPVDSALFSTGQHLLFPRHALCPRSCCFGGPAVHERWLRVELASTRPRCCTTIPKLRSRCTLLSPMGCLGLARHGCSGWAAVCGRWGLGQTGDLLSLRPTVQVLAAGLTWPPCPSPMSGCRCCAAGGVAECWGLQPSYLCPLAPYPCLLSWPTGPMAVPGNSAEASG